MCGLADLSQIWPGKLEMCLRVLDGQKSTPEWQAKNTDPKSLAQMRQDHPDFMAVCDTVHQWICKQGLGESLHLFQPALKMISCFLAS